jgi:transcription initiation factor TFIID TATA-box-binding protein
MKHRYKLKWMCQDGFNPPTTRIQNVVSTFSLGVSGLNLRKLSLQIPFCDYNPPRFAAMTMRLRHPRTTALTFSSGNMVCTGSKNIGESLYACRKYVRLLQHYDIRVCFHNFRVQNIVASAAVGFPMRLVDLAKDHGAFVSYEPDLFPGLVLRIQEPKIVFLIFRSGKVVITGARRIEDIENTFRGVYCEFLVKYRDLAETTASSSEYRVRTKHEMAVSSAASLGET